MAKPDLGTKRTCGNCGSKFYDLNRDPIICPKCQTEFQEVATAPAPAPLKTPAPAEEKAAKEGPEIVSLEDAEEERAGAKRGAPAEDEDEFDLGDEALEDEDEAFLEEEEDEEDDVSGLIGGGIDADDEEA